jgi:spore germination cell wall hydrolase CwlJ-like protein
MKIKAFFSVALLLGVLVSGLIAPPVVSAAGREVPPDALRCLALAVYFEAGSEPQLGKEAVAHVVLNRAQHAGFPGGVCGVVQQGGQQRPCQFGWYCDGRSDEPASSRTWQSAREVARQVLAGRVGDPTDGALYFTQVRSGRQAWTRRLTQVARIGGHVFYR